jgi:predicted DNA-binding protein
MTHHRRNRRGQKDRKERVLHTRVPEVLEAELKRLSEALRLPVSNIVRAAIEDVLEAAQAVTRTASEEVQDIADRFTVLRRRAERYGQAYAEKPEEPDEPGVEDEDEKEQSAERPSQKQVERALRGVIGFHKITLARDTSCGLCGRDMAAGEAAFLAVRDRKGRRIILGSECLPAPEQKDKREETADNNEEKQDG